MQSLDFMTRLINISMVSLSRNIFTIVTLNKSEIET
jgi:hypothetical protein